MSNPAVIVLDEVKKSKKNVFKRFVLEDNVGEAIHLHVDNMRIDFTVDEFLEFSSMIRESLEDMDFLDGYSLENFDAYFLKECSVFFDKFKNITIEEIKISELQCIEHVNYKNRFKLMKLSPASQIPAYRYLKGDKNDFLVYSQFNYFNQNNEQRLNDLAESIKANGYPYNNQYVILFNGQNIVRDGQHRVAILASLYGMDYKIKVMKFNFDGDKHYFNIGLSNYKKIIVWFLRKVKRKIKQVIKK